MVTFFCALIFGCVFQFNLLFSNQFLSSLIEPTIYRGRNLQEMGKAEKLSPSPTYSKSGSKRSKMIVKAVRQTDKNATGQHATATSAMKMDEAVETDRETSESDENWQTVMNQRSNKIQKTNNHAPTTTMSFFGQKIPQDQKTSGVHSYFSFGGNGTRTRPTSPQHGLEKSSPGGSSANTDGRRKKSNLPPFKLEFEAQQKPMEIRVLNDLVKHNGRLNVNTASYSTHPQSRHVLLVFANDAPTYEILFESSSWPTSICGLPFKVTLPSRIPTSYSILVNRIPREWHVDSIRPLIAQRYLSTVQVTRIFRDSQPINRIRVDFRSNDDVQTILQCSHISIDSIRYPAVAYKPLARIDRCFRCQQFGHKAAKCSNEPKCYKCGESHEYNRDCANVVKCANCNGQHMAGSPECPVKISYRREKRQQQEEKRETNPQQPSSYLSSPARLYSSVLQTMAPQVHAETKTRKMTSDHPAGPIDQSSIIINALKEEIGRSQGVLLNRIMQLEEKCDAVHGQQAALQWTIETQIVPYMSTMSELLVDVCEQLAKPKVITLTDQQQTKIRRLRLPPTTPQMPFSPSPFSQGFSTAHPRQARQQPSSAEVNCTLSPPFTSLSSQ